MPTAAVTLPDIELTVSRPIVYQISKDIFTLMNLPNDPIILYGGKRETIANPNSDISKLGDKEARFDTNNMCFITVKEKPRAEDIQETAAYSFNQKAIFSDPKLKFSLRPIFFSTDMNLTITYRSQSETEIRRCIAYLQEKASRGRATNLHTVNYSYPLSFEFLNLLEHIYTLREATEGYGDSFPEYFAAHATSDFSVLCDQGGGNRHLVVNKRASRIMGNFDFTTTPEEPTYLKDKGVWELSFGYEFNYQRVEGVTVRYPINVHNQLIDTSYTNFLSDIVDPEMHHKQGPQDVLIDEYFGMDHLHQTRQPTTYIQIPSYDDFSIDKGPYGTATVAMVLVDVDKDKKTLLDLNELGEYQLDADVLEFIRTEGQNAVELYKSVFNIALYINDRLMPPGSIELTPDLVVKSKTVLSYRDTHHIRISILPSIHATTYQSLRRLANNARAFTKVVATMNELLVLDPDFMQLDANPKIEPWQFEAVYRTLTAMDQGIIGSPNSSIPQYRTEPGTSTRNNFAYLTKLPQSTIDRYLSQKRRMRFTVMVGYIIAKKRKY